MFFRTEKWKGQTMPRKLKAPKIDSRSARERLPRRAEPFWAVISRGRALGYRKGAKGGTWIARLRGEDGKQHYHPIGVADDIEDPDGREILSYGDALDAARIWFEAQKNAGGAQARRGGPYTVADAISDYMASYDANKGKARDRMDAVINAHILPALGTVPVKKLTTRRLKEWRDSVRDTPPRQRSRKGAAPAFRQIDNSPDARRRRESTANRILTVLKSALNHALADPDIPVYDGTAWQGLKPYRNADRARVRYLTEAETTRLINACDGPFRTLVTAALLTGARYGELSAARVADFDARAGTLYVPESKSERPRYIALTAEGVDYFTELTAGREGSELILRRADGGRWGRSQQSRPLKEACERAAIDPPIGFHGLRHTYGARLAMRGVPMPVIAAQLGHSDTRTTERHYAHLGPSYVADTVRGAFGELGIASASNIVRLSY
jgi:integrase